MCFESLESKKKDSSPTIAEEEEAKKEPEPMKTESKEAAAASQSEAAQLDPQAMPVPKISHDWYQTETQVVVEVRIKKLKADECKIEIGETNLSVTAALPSGSEYSLELDLAHPVVPAQSGYKVLLINFLQMEILISTP